MFKKNCHLSRGGNKVTLVTFKIAYIYLKYIYNVSLPYIEKSLLLLLPCIKTPTNPVNTMVLR